MDTAVYEKKAGYPAVGDIADFLDLADSLQEISRDAAGKACREEVSVEPESFRNIFLLCTDIMTMGASANTEYRLGVYKSEDSKYSVFIRITEDEYGELEYKTRVKKQKLKKGK